MTTNIPHSCETAVVKLTYPRLAVWDGHVAMIVGNGMMIDVGSQQRSRASGEFSHQLRRLRPSAGPRDRRSRRHGSLSSAR